MKANNTMADPEMSHVSKSTKRGFLHLDVFEPSNPKHLVDPGHPILWLHRNGYWYILFGPRLRRMVSTQTKDRRLAEASLASFTERLGSAGALHCNVVASESRLETALSP